MNPSSKNKILVWAVILLIIANTAVLVVLWHTHNKQYTNRGTPADYLIKELGLNTEQQTKLKELANQHHQQAQGIIVKIKDARDSLFNLFQESDVNDTIKNNGRDIFLNKISENFKELELLTFNHFKQVRAICTPEQQKKFDEIIQDVLRMMAEGPPQGLHRPPPQGGFEHNPPPEEDRMPPPNH